MTKTYTVIADAVTIATGRVNPQNRKPEVVRLVKGQQVESDVDNPAIQTHLSMKAIRPSEDATGKERITARHVVRIFRSDVTGEPMKSVEPIDAPMPVSDPNEV